MKAILVDDEIIALEVMANALEPYDDVEIVGIYTDPAQAIKASEIIEPDVVFLDIELGEKNGILVAGEFKSKSKSPEIVFVTAYSEYAIEAFELNAVDYLLKPIQKSRLERTIERLRTTIGENQNEDIDGEVEGLILESFGAFVVTDHRGNNLKWRTKKSKELFAYLWVHKDKPLPKDALIEEIFYDKELEKATTLLHTSIYQLRKNLEKLGYKDAVIFRNDSYQLNLSIESDLEEMLLILNSNIIDDKNAKKIIDNYKGEFLEKEGYSWAIPMQQMYNSLVTEYLTQYATKKLSRGEATVQLRLSLEHLYDLDPYNDKIAMLAIEYFSQADRITCLEKFYKNYCTNLWEEMELKPSQETVEYYEKCMKGKSDIKEVAL